MSNYYDLWSEASVDHDEMARTAALARVDAELEDVMPFLLAARTPQEYGHRRAMAEHRLNAIAMRYGLMTSEVADIATRRFELYHEAVMQKMALPEGESPLAWVPDGGGFGSGPEKGYEHDETVDYSHGYSEIPQGAPGGPSPAVTVPRITEPAQAVQEATGAKRCSCGRKLSEGDCKGCGDSPGDCDCSPKKSASLRRTADDSGDPSNYLATMPPDTGTGPGSVDIGTGSAPPTLASSVGGGNTTPLNPQSIGQVTSSADPVHRQVISVAASIAATNPGLPDGECRRIARQVVGRYLTADLTDSIVHDDPVSSSGGGSQNTDSGGTGPLGHVLEWKGLKSMLPGGAGDAAGAGAEAGGAEALAELAPLALA